MEVFASDIHAHPDAAILWRDERLLLLDQRLLPAEERYLELTSCAAAARAITDMVVRGAPALGVTAAYAVVLAARQRYAASPHGWRGEMAGDLDLLAAARPTAVNLGWAVARMRSLIATLDGGDPVPALLWEAERIHREDVASNRAMGAIGAALIERKTSVITHCNAGALATGGYGTALGVIRSAWSAGLIEQVFADETRPWLQGSRLTAWELAHDGIAVRIMTEGAAGRRMQQGGVDWVIVGSDRIAANGDVVNKIGTYNLAVLARHHDVRFMVAAPTSTIDLATATGAEIPIEQRDPSEVLCCGGSRQAAAGIDAWNPVFDVTPAELVDVIVTEKGAVRSPNRKKMAELMVK
ncbi:MAG: S-methyl-5-thioribose-1-phosphate isomerase [Gammaproteobacteria bacterium]|nr:S-methyl-5-thioribose-1-phosphate isomerase [Gammaproteobacteria bacterium]